MNIFYLTSVEKIIIGGKISKIPRLISKVKNNFVLMNNSYVEVNVDDLIYFNEDDESALKGCLYLH